jgi:excinuclease ABC subunit C
MATEILRGNIRGVRRQLEESMYAYAEAEQFEAAATCRDTIAALERLQDRQNVVASPDTEQDVIALHSGELCSVISIFYIREGAITDKAEFLFGSDQIVDEAAMTTFLSQHYATRDFIPQKILLSFEPEEEDEETLTAYLSQLAGHKVQLRTPERGGSRQLCEMVRANAEQRAKLYETELEQENGTLLRLATLLQLETLPERIEAYDISNWGSEVLRAGMIVCKNGKFSRSDYRSFQIKSVEGTDDYASMREVLDRRLAHLEEDETGSFAEYPDLILLDGGRGHVSVIRELLRERNLDIPVFGMVKDDYHKTRALCTDTGEIQIAREQQVFALIFRIQEEVHRFSVRTMNTAKRKTIRHSVLEEIPGIGAKKAKELLAALGGLGGVREADPDALRAVKGIRAQDAEAIYDYFHGAEPEGDAGKKG